MYKVLTFNPEDLSNDEVLDEFISVMKREIDRPNELQVSLKKTGKINLSQFNSLISLYVYMSRIGKKIHYSETGSSVKKYVDLTRFHHVFSN